MFVGNRQLGGGAIFDNQVILLLDALLAHAS